MERCVRRNGRAGLGGDERPAAAPQLIIDHKAAPVVALRSLVEWTAWPPPLADAAVANYVDVAGDAEARYSVQGLTEDIVPVDGDDEEGSRRWCWFALDHLQLPHASSSTMRE